MPPPNKRRRQQESKHFMWPFKRKRKAAEPTSAGPIVGGPIFVSQVDITERFGDDERLGPDDWIPTIPMNTIVENPESMGLPPVGADANEVYRVASHLSSVREAVPIPTDGVYCPVCHIANVDIGKLRTPCPRCQRELLKFGWD